MDFKPNRKFRRDYEIEILKRRVLLKRQSIYLLKAKIRKHRRHLVTLILRYAAFKAASALTRLPYTTRLSRWADKLLVIAEGEK